jgi:hypothetical protein
MKIWTKQAAYRKVDFESEAELERAVVLLQKELFGDDRIYVDVKKKIGSNIPDGYLLDLSGSRPRLYVVENELKRHDPVDHVAIQLLKFSLSFQKEPMRVKQILATSLRNDSGAAAQCERYARTAGFHSLDHLLEDVVAQDFAALVIIDDVTEILERVLSEKFQFGVEVLELSAYRSDGGETIFHFTPLLADLPVSTSERQTKRLDTSLIDTIVVPAQDYGFISTFLGENRWWAVRVHGSLRRQLKYIATYRVAPVSAITHIAPIKSIEPWKRSDKVVINLAAPATEIGPIPLVKGGKVKAPQNVRYAIREQLLSARNLDDLWR